MSPGRPLSTRIHADGIAVSVHALHPVVAAQYVRVLSAQRGLRVVDPREPAGVAVFDGDRVFVVTALARRPGVRAIVLAETLDEDACARWIRAGAWGLVSYTGYELELPRAVRQVAAGGMWFPPALTLRWMQDQAAIHAATRRFPLTAREQEVFELVVTHLSNKEIAAMLRISERTVKFHVGNILAKLQVASRRELEPAAPARGN